jgi:DNA-directed RNA polymerase subunit RPC12/RpoP
MEEGKTGIELELNEEKLLYYLIDYKIKVIEPTIYYDSITYESVKDFEDYKNKKEFDQLLDALTEKDYLSKTEHDRVIQCPNCGSKHHETKYNCPQCNSTRVRRFELIEHLDCGYVGELDEFPREENTLTCPKCSTKFQRNSDAYDVIGISYICDSCGYKFDKPNASHHCQNCGTIYDYTNSIYPLTYTYRITDKITELIPVREVRETLRALEKLFQEREYTVTLEGTLTGKSGEEKLLSVIAEKNPDLIILDISPWGKVDNLINLLGKKMDIEPKTAVMIDLSEENKLKPHEEIYKIKVLSGKDPTYIEKLGEYLDSLDEPIEEKKTFFSSILDRTRKQNQKEKKELDEETE